MWNNFFHGGVKTTIVFFKIVYHMMQMIQCWCPWSTLKTKAFGWALVQIGHLIRLGRLLKKQKITKITKNLSKSSQKLITKKFLFLLFKLAPSSNWVVKRRWALSRTWMLIRMFFIKTGGLDWVLNWAHRAFIVNLTVHLRYLNCFNGNQNDFIPLTLFNSKLNLQILTVFFCILIINSVFTFAGPHASSNDERTDNNSG